MGLWYSFLTSLEVESRAIEAELGPRMLKLRQNTSEGSRSEKVAENLARPRLIITASGRQDRSFIEGLIGPGPLTRLYATDKRVRSYTARALQEGAHPSRNPGQSRQVYYDPPRKGARCAF